MKNVIKFIAMAIVFAFVACSDSTDDNLDGSIPNTALAGTVFNTNFVATGGKAFLVGSQSSDGQSSESQISINITNVEADCSSSIFNYDLYVSTTVENKVGTSTTNVVFGKDGETPKNVIQSTVVVESITETEIVVKIKSSTTGSKVEGTFTVPFCK
ncbi:hypothetical protein [Tenacibaculum ovolyticum]|uniref:hypothetical protein n=1 Tax=Tenacibaculum ovolyticum TaxID=104270 RepID=UPI003BAC73AD